MYVKNIKAPLMSHDKLTTAIIDYEDGWLNLGEVVDLFSCLIQTGLAWTLQGSYGRTARHLVDCGHLTSDGTILYEELPF
tara:strand:+ start:1035 stop:1274 length:240 start_codon:yes stop_codon:yes gene_type:complete